MDLTVLSSSALTAANLHTSIKRDRQITKFWLNPIVLVKNKGFKERELNQITRLVVKHQEILMEAWHDYFGS